MVTTNVTIVNSSVKNFAGTTGSSPVTIASPASAPGQLIFVKVSMQNSGTGASNGGASMSNTTGAWTTLAGATANTGRTPSSTSWLFMKVAVAGDLGVNHTCNVSGASGTPYFLIQSVAVNGVNGYRSSTIASQGATTSTPMTVAGNPTYVSGDVAMSHGSLFTTSTAVNPTPSVSPVDADTLLYVMNSYASPTYGVAGFFALSSGTPGDRSFTLSRLMYRTTGQVILIPIPSASHPGGTITGAGKLGTARGFQNKVQLKYAATTSSTSAYTVQLPAATYLTDGWVLLWVVQVLNTTATTAAADLAVPAGWTVLADTLNGAQTTQRLVIFTRIATPSLAVTNATATPTATTNMTFTSHVIVMAGGTLIPHAQQLTAGGSTTYSPGAAIPIPAVAGSSATDIVLSLISAQTTATGAGSRPWTTLPPPAGGVVWSTNDTNLSTVNGLTQITMWWPGAQSTYNPAAAVRAITGQLAYQPLKIVAHKGGTITGYSKLITTSSGTKKIPVGRTKAITGYAKITAQRGTFVAKPQYHQGKLIGYFAEQPASHVYKRVRPHLRKHTELVQTTNSSGQQVMVSQQVPTVQILTQDSATTLSFTIPADTQPTDMVFIEVGFAGGSSITAPDGWQQLDTFAVATSAVHATFYRLANWTDAGTTVLITGAGSPAQMEGVLAVYTPGIVDTASSTTMSTGSTRVVFGPTTSDPGTTRIIAGTFRATLTGDQIAFSKPLTVLNGAIAATPQVQEANNSALSLGSVIGDYTGTTNLQGQFTAQVPVLGRIEVIDVEGVEFHRGTINQTGHLGGGQGVKHATDGTNQYAQIVAYFGKTTPNDHSGAHTDIGAAGDPGCISAEASIWPGPGLKYDSYHGGRIDGYQQLTGSGCGDHDTGYGGEIHNYGHIYVRRGSEMAKHAGGALTGYAVLHGEGGRTRIHPGTPITGYAAMLGISGSTRVNVIKGYAKLTAEHEADHSDRLAKGGPGRIKGYFAGLGWGIAQAAIDERYTQIRGYALINGQGIAGTVRPYGIGGPITGYALLDAYDLTPKTPEDIGVDITLGPVIVLENVIDGPEDFELSIITGRPTVLRLVPYEMFKSSAYYGGGSRPNTVGVRATRAGSGSVFRTDPGYPFTTGTGQAYDGIEGTGP